MEIQFVLNDKQVKAEVGADTILLNVLRDLGCKSVKVRLRDDKLWIVYSLDQRKIPPFLLGSCRKYRGRERYDFGRR